MKDKKIERLIKAEAKRQKGVVNLIASENYVSKDVLAALGSELTNKYAEGYAGARYYGGNKMVDEVERECQKRALKLFKLKEKDWTVNVQPLSGSPANVAVYLALVPPAGKIMGMTLAHGGHLTHGHKVSITGKMWQQVPYGVDEKTEKIDYEKLKELALREKPQLIVAGFTAKDLREGRYVARGRPGGRRRVSIALPICRCGNHDDSQDFARPALGPYFFSSHPRKGISFSYSFGSRQGRDGQSWR